MNTPHTPGPWLTRKPESSRPESARLDIVTEAGEFSPSFVAGDALPQDARLISAAPDLLDALQFLLADWIAINGDRITGSRVPAEKAMAAIAKATGE
jgi:hypothetical protein